MTSRTLPVGVTADDVFSAWVAGPTAKLPPLSTKTGLQGVLFDLDGVLVDTASFHYRAWKQLADELGIPFNEQVNHGFRGVGRMECLDKLLREHSKTIAAEEKHLLAERKNAYYLEQVMTLKPSDLAQGARALAMRLRASGIRMGLVSASRNAKLVLSLLGIMDWFDSVVDGADVTRGKPDPEGFLVCAERMRVRPEQCVVIEDAEAGIRAGHAAGMKCVGIGESALRADVRAWAVCGISVEELEKLVGSHNRTA